MFPKQNTKKVVVKKKKVITQEVLEINEKSETEPFEHVDERPGHQNQDLNIASHNYMNL